MYCVLLFLPLFLPLCRLKPSLEQASIQEPFSILGLLFPRSEKIKPSRITFTTSLRWMWVCRGAAILSGPSEWKSRLGPYVGGAGGLQPKEWDVSFWLLYRVLTHGGALIHDFGAPYTLGPLESPMVPSPPLRLPCVFVVAPDLQRRRHLCSVGCGERPAAAKLPRSHSRRPVSGPRPFRDRKHFCVWGEKKFKFLLGGECSAVYF